MSKLTTIAAVTLVTMTLAGCSSEHTSPDPQEQKVNLKQNANQEMQSSSAEQPNTKTEEKPKSENKPKTEEPKPTPKQEPKPVAAQVASAQDTKSQSWYYMRKGNGKVPDFPLSNQQKQVYFVGSGKNVYLTFDNGGELGEIDRILSILRANNVKATFFITGTNMKLNPSVIAKVVSEGHLVANHSVTHSDFTTLSDVEIQREIKDAESLYKSATGQEMLHYFRYPYGKYSQHTLDLIAGMGYKTVFWSTAMKDWVPRDHGWQDAYNDVMNNLHDGNVILMHQASKEDTDALDKIIKDIKAKGYAFHLVSDF